uniref:Uncharacterized protein n=1 Tax=Meleagris gallopavo TaxID=9103 RepID=G1NBU3_MELGA
MWLSMQFPPWPYFSSKSTMTVRAFSAVSALSSPSLKQKEDVIFGITSLNITIHIQIGSRWCQADCGSHVAKKLLKKMCCIFNCTKLCQCSSCSFFIIVDVLCVLVSHSILSCLLQIWSLIVVLLSKKYKQLPHMITTNLLVAQFIACIGMVIWNFTVKQEDVTVQILVFIFLYSSLYSTYLWTGFLSFSLFLLRKRETVKIPIGFIIIAGWGVPTLLVGILLIIGEHNSSSIDSAFFYGKHQIITTAVVLFISILMSGISLMCMNRNRQESNYEVLNPYSPHGQAEGNEGNQVSATVKLTILLSLTGCCSCQTTNGEISCAKEGKAVPNAVENKVPSIETADQCVNQCSAQTCVLAQEEQLLQTADKQLARHVLLCLLLVVGLFANLSSCLWWLFNQEPGRLYVELQFFCAVFNFGQGFISFGIFGLDKHLIILPFKRRLEFLWGGREAEGHADPTLPEEIRMTCQQFVHYHRDHCVKSIVKGRSHSVGDFCSDLFTQTFK